MTGPTNIMPILDRIEAQLLALAALLAECIATEQATS